MCGRHNAITTASHSSGAIILPLVTTGCDPAADTDDRIFFFSPLVNDQNGPTSDQDVQIRMRKRS